MNTEKTVDKLPSLLILADRRGGAFDTISRSLALRLKEAFSCTIRFVLEKPDLSPDRFDLLYVMFWGESYYKRFSVPPGKIIKEVASHRWEIDDTFGKLSPDTFFEKYLSDCTCITTPSRRLFNQLSPLSKKVYLCPCGIETDLFHPRRKRTGPLRIGWTGNPKDACKGLHDILIPACGERFNFRYSDGSWNWKKIADFYQQIDVIAIASEAEGQPLPLMEGMACGCFPVTTDVGIVPELVKSGFNGLVVKRDSESFRTAFEWCEINIERIRNAGALNVSLCADTRNWDDHFQKFIQVFQTALGHKMPLPPGTPAQHGSSCTDAPSTIGKTMEKQDYAGHLQRINPETTSETAYRASTVYYQNELKPLLPVNRDCRIVEIGTGYGHLLRYLLENGYLHVGGVDSSEDLVRKIQEYLGSGPDFIEHATAQEFLKMKKVYFDAIILFDVIEHIPKEELLYTVRAMHDALVPGGRVILRTPNMANVLGIFSRYIDLTHVNGFTEFSLAQLFIDAGFARPVVHIPDISGTWKQKLQIKILRIFHRKLYQWQDRMQPSCYDKNIVMYAEKSK